MLLFAMLHNNIRRDQEKFLIAFFSSTGWESRMLTLSYTYSILRHVKIVFKDYELLYT